MTTPSVGQSACVELAKEIPNSPTELFCYPPIDPQVKVPTFGDAAGWVTNWRTECGGQAENSYRVFCLRYTMRFRASKSGRSGTTPTGLASNPPQTSAPTIEHFRRKDDPHF